MAITPKKKALLAKIHIAKKDLCLDDGTYRDVLRRVTGKDSSSKMLMSELERVIYEFGNLGWKPSAAAKPKHGKKPTVSTAIWDYIGTMPTVSHEGCTKKKNWNFVPMTSYTKSCKD